MDNSITVTDRNDYTSVLPAAELHPPAPVAQPELLRRLDADIRGEALKVASLSQEDIARKQRGALALRAVLAVHMGQSKLGPNDITDGDIAAFDVIRKALDTQHAAKRAGNDPSADLALLSRMSAAAE